MHEDGTGERTRKGVKLRTLVLRGLLSGECILRCKRYRRGCHQRSSEEGIGEG